MMWRKLKALCTIKGAQGPKLVPHSPKVEEEYLNVLRTQSYAHYLSKAQSLVRGPSSSSQSFAQVSEILLEPCQESVSTILQSTTFSKQSDLKSLVQKFFDMSAEASKICTHLLYSVRQTQANQKFIKRAISLIRNGSPPEEFKSAMLELDSFILLKNPFSMSNKHDFDSIHEQYSLMLHHLNLKKKKVARKIKLIKYLKKGSQIALTAAGGVVAAAVLLLATHMFVGLLVGPALIGCSSVRLRKKKPSMKLSRNGSLKKVGVQLDVAAKGTYILNRDFDTMSRLVGRVRDEIDHNRAMIRFCFARREDRYPLQEVVKELRKSDEAFMNQVEELEEHVYLCLVMINRARVLVVKEMEHPTIVSQQEGNSN